MKTLFAVLVVMLAGCADPEGELKALVKGELSDPDSAQFTDVMLSSGKDCIGGKVNAKNKFGGYVGPQAFFASREKVFISHDPGSASDAVQMYLDCSLKTWAAKASG